MAAALVSVEEYLGRSYEPDGEYVAERLVERHAGEYLHSRLQGLGLGRAVELGPLFEELARE
jgi:hypothetical protein